VADQTVVVDLADGQAQQAIRLAAVARTHLLVAALEAVVAQVRAEAEPEEVAVPQTAEAHRAVRSRKAKDTTRAPNPILAKPHSRVVLLVGGDARHGSRFVGHAVPWHRAGSAATEATGHSLPRSVVAESISPYSSRGGSGTQRQARSPQHVVPARSASFS
jgi:hypothetical protein